MSHNRLLTNYLDKPWLITEGALEQMMEIYFAAISRKEVFDISPEALEAKASARLDNTRNVDIRDGIAIIHVNGPIMRYAGMFDDISGATSTAQLAYDFEAAFNNPKVNGIILNIDSPGGEAKGINELAERIYNARISGIKPIKAYNDGQCCSGAMWIASAAEEIISDETALAGCIGVAGIFRDRSKADAKLGIVTKQIVSTQTPKKRPDIMTPEGEAQLQTVFDAIGTVFITKLSRNRGMSVEEFISKFDGGATMPAQLALKAGLIDRIGSFESLLIEMGDEIAERRLSARDKGPEGDKSKTSGADDNEDETIKSGAKPPLPTSKEKEQIPIMVDKNDGTDKTGAGSGADKEKTTPDASLKPAAAADEGKDKGKEEKPAGGAAMPPTLAALPAGQIVVSEAEFNRLKAGAEQNAKTQEALQQTQATDFIDRVIRAGKADPHQKAHLVSRYLRCAKDDALNPTTEEPVAWAEKLDGQQNPTGVMEVVKTGTRLEAFMAEFDTAQPHLMDKDMIQSREPAVLGRRSEVDYDASESDEEREARKDGRELATKLNKRRGNNETPAK